MGRKGKGGRTSYRQESGKKSRLCSAQQYEHGHAYASPPTIGRVGTGRVFGGEQNATIGQELSSRQIRMQSTVLRDGHGQSEGGEVVW